MEVFLGNAREKRGPFRADRWVDVFQGLKPLAES